MAHLIEALIEKYKAEGRNVTELCCVFFEKDDSGNRIEVWDVSSEHGRKFMNCYFMNDLLYYGSPMLRNLECACNSAARKFDDEAADFNWSPNELYESADCPWTRGDSFNPQFN